MMLQQMLQREHGVRGNLPGGVPQFIHDRFQRQLRVLAWVVLDESDQALDADRLAFIDRVA